MASGVIASTHADERVALLTGRGSDGSRNTNRHARALGWVAIVAGATLGVAAIAGVGSETTGGIAARASRLGWATGAGIKQRGGSFGLVGAAKRGVGRSLEAASETQCLYACSDALSQAALERLGAGRGTCADMDAFPASCLSGCTCVEKTSFDLLKRTVCVDGQKTHGRLYFTLDNDAWTRKLDAELVTQCSDINDEDFKTDEELRGHEVVVGNERDEASNQTSLLGARRFGARLFPHGYSDAEKSLLGRREEEWRPMKGPLVPAPPRPAERAGHRAPSTFRLYTQCKPTEVKREGGEFWFSAITGAYLVRHNYGSPDFFGPATKIRMERRELGDGIYGYELTTNRVDWEYGFELVNANGEKFREIGSDTILQRENCTVRYGVYFNRHMTYHKGETTIGAVFGDCGEVCPEDFVDTAFCRQPFSAEIPETESAALSLGQIDDARLVNLASVLLYSSSTEVMDPSGRTETFRYDAGSKDEQIWIAAAIDYDREYVKMVRFIVKRDPTTEEGSIYMSDKKRYELTTTGGYAYQEWTTGYSNRVGCSKGYCNVARYDVPAFWDAGSETTGFSATRLEYFIQTLGDAPPTSININYDGQFLSTSGTQIVAPGQWGEDMDVRRIIMKNAVLCGAAINHLNCMYGKAFPLNAVSGYSGPSKTRKDWLFIVVEHVYFKMVRISVTLAANKGVTATAVAAGYVEHVRDAADINTSDSMAYDGSAKWGARNNMDVAPNLDGGGYGVGGIKFDIAAEMSASLRGVDCES